jgi:hypothetical protein
LSLGGSALGGSPFGSPLGGSTLGGTLPPLAPAVVGSTQGAAFGLPEVPAPPHGGVVITAAPPAGSAAEPIEIPPGKHSLRQTAPYRPQELASISAGSLSASQL